MPGCKLSPLRLGGYRKLERYAYKYPMMVLNDQTGSCIAELFLLCCSKYFFSMSYIHHPQVDLLILRSFCLSSSVQVVIPTPEVTES